MLAIIMVIEDDTVRGKVEKVYSRYYGTMIYVAQGILHDKALAEDAVSEAFIRIIDNVEKIGEVNCNKTRGYVVTIVRNISLNMIEQRNRQVMLPIEEYLDSSDCHDPVLESLTMKEACQEISDAILRLHKSYSDILFLKLVHQYSDKEIAQILGISDDNARARLSRARKALRAELKRGQYYD